MELSIHNVVDVFRDDDRLSKTSVTNLCLVSSDGETIRITIFHDQATLPIQQVGDADREARHKAVEIQQRKDF